jgi:hypothetical protein
MIHKLWIAVTGALLVACGTGRSYEGPKRPADEVARITGDFRVTAGSPVTVILLKVDDYEVSLSENSVEVLPGTHKLLVDCRVAETKSVSRFTIEAELYEGVRYRLVPQISPGMRGCSAVELDSD